ncbi:MAG: tetratricopeptide repeat protein [Robiginitomaculum sp.]|nr:tetratricopeptide repeat protein [Robiginitomaculum sp.]
MKHLFLIIIFMVFGAGFAYAQEADLPPPAPAPKEKLKTDETASEAPKGGKDLTVRSEQDRAVMLKDLFATLKAAPDEEEAKLVAEEVWAVFLQSGSASVDFLLHRGIAAQNRGDNKLARRMYDHVLRLQPDYAEGWSRSGRLAADEKDLSRAVSDTTQALILEPRHFYALWTLGNILETLERPDDAFEVYEEANKIYPQHKQIKERVEHLRESAKGKAL